MTPAQRLEAVGRLLYGDRGWKSPLADRVGVDRRTVRRWLSGESPLPPEHGVFRDLRGVLERALGLLP